MTIIIFALITAFAALYVFAVRENTKPQANISWKINAETDNVTNPEK